MSFGSIGFNVNLNHIYCTCHLIVDLMFFASLYFHKNTKRFTFFFYVFNDHCFTSTHNALILCSIFARYIRCNKRFTSINFYKYIPVFFEALQLVSFFRTMHIKCQLSLFHLVAIMQWYNIGEFTVKHS